MRSTRSRAAAEPLSYPGSRTGPESTGAAAGRGSRTALCLWLPTFELRLELVRSPALDSTSVALRSTEGIRA